MRRLVSRDQRPAVSPTEHCLSLTPSWQSQAGVPGYMFIVRLFEVV